MASLSATMMTSSLTDPGGLLAVETPRRWNQWPLLGWIRRLLSTAAVLVPLPCNNPAKLTQFFKRSKRHCCKWRQQRVHFLFGEIPCRCRIGWIGCRDLWGKKKWGRGSQCLALATQRGFSRPLFSAWPASLVSWPRPSAFIWCQRRQGRVGCRTSLHPFKSGRRAGSGVVSTGRAISQLSGWVVSAGAPSSPSSTILAVLPWSSQRAHEIMALPLLRSPPYFCFIRPHHGRRRWRKGVREDASSRQISGRASLAALCYRLEGKGRLPV